MALLLAYGSRAADGQTVVDALDVSVVEIDVSVRDRQGRSVEGLAKKDFRVTLDGAPLEITNFRASTTTPAARSGASPAETERPEGLTALGGASETRLLLLYFDESALDRGQRAALVRRLTESLAGLAPGARVMVAGRKANSLRIYQPFTDRLDLLTTAVEAAAQGAPDNPTAAAVSAFLNDIERALSAIDDRPQASARGQSRVLSARASSLVGEAVQRVAQSGEFFEQLIFMLGGLPGRKGLLYIGDGLALSPGEVIGSALREVFSRFEMRSVSDSLDSTSAASLGGAWLAEAAAQAASREVAVYALDTTDALASPSVSAEYRSMDFGRSGGAAPTDTWTPGISSRRRAEIQNALQGVAERTGGRLVQPHRGDLLKGVFDDLATYYSLGIRAPGTDPPPGALEVTVEGRGLQVHHRRAAQRRSVDAIDADRTIAALLGTPLDEGQGRPLAAVVTVGEISAGEEGSVVVPLTVAMPIEDLRFVARGLEHAAQLSVFVATRDAQGRISAVRRTTLPVTLANTDLATALGQRVEYRQELLMPPGPADVAIAVRDDIESALTLTTLHLEVAASATPATQ